MVNTSPRSVEVQSPGRQRTKPYVVVVFGRTGVGISSLVNLIAGYPVSNNRASTRTKAPHIKPYTVSFSNSSKQFLLYEVPGFGGLIEDRTILKTIRRIERDEGIDLFLYCLRKQKTTVLPSILHQIRNGTSRQHVPIVAVVTELERFGAQMDEWWNSAVEDGSTNGTIVERMCFGEGDRFDAHACVTTLPRREVDLILALRKRRDQSEDVIRRLVLDQCSRPKRGE